MTKFVEWIRRALHERNWSGRELARQAHISSALVTQMMRYGHIPGPDVVRAVSNALGMDENVALEVAGYVVLTNFPPELSARIKDFQARLAALPQEEQDFVWELIESALRRGESRHDESRGQAG